MEPDDLRILIDFDSRLRVGQVVEARWTNNYRYYRAPARVVTVNRQSVGVELLVPVGEYRGGPMYPVGHRIGLPRIQNFKAYTANNGVWPITASKRTDGRNPVRSGSYREICPACGNPIRVNPTAGTVVCGACRARSEVMSQTGDG